MSDLPPLRTIKSITFNQCVNEIAESFKANRGEITRSRFGQICRSYDYDYQPVQAYFERAGMWVSAMERGRKSPMDRFVWRLEE